MNMGMQALGGEQSYLFLSYYSKTKASLL